MNLFKVPSPSLLKCTYNCIKVDVNNLKFHRFKYRLLQSLIHFFVIQRWKKSLTTEQ